MSSGFSHLYEIPFDPVKLVMTGPPVDALPGSRRVMSADVSPDGAWLAFSTSGGQEDLFIVRRDGSELRQLTNDPARDRNPVWSPDGSRLAFYSTRSGNYDIWTMRPDGSDAQQMTRGTPLAEPLWSPDGKRIAATKIHGGAYAFDAVVPARLEALPTLEKAKFTPSSWSSDGTRICGTLYSAEGFELLGSGVFDVATKQLTKVWSGSGWTTCLGEHHLVIFPLRPGRLLTFDLRTKELRDAGTFPLQGANAKLGRGGTSILSTSPATEADIWMVAPDGATQP